MQKKEITLILEELAAYDVLICGFNGDKTVPGESSHNGLEVAAHQVFHQLHLSAKMWNAGPEDQKNGQRQSIVST